MIKNNSLIILILELTKYINKRCNVLIVMNNCEEEVQLFYIVYS